MFKYYKKTQCCIPDTQHLMLNNFRQEISTEKYQNCLNLLGSNAIPIFYEKLQMFAFRNYCWTTCSHRTLDSEFAFIYDHMVMRMLLFITYVMLKCNRLKAVLY